VEELLSPAMGLTMLGSLKNLQKAIRPKSGSFEVEITNEKFKRCKLLGIDHISAEFTHAGGNSLRDRQHY
jgi:hypothetical protein